MKYRRIKILMLLMVQIPILILTCPNLESAFNKDFLGNARYIGLSGAFVAQCDDESAIFVNPAGLINLKTLSVGITWGDMYEGMDYGDIYRQNIGIGVNLSRILPESLPLGTVGLGIDHFSAGLEDYMKYTETVYVLSYAKSLLAATGFGINIKIPRWASDLEGDTSYRIPETIVSIDLGILLIESRNLTIGGAFYDINQPTISAKSKTPIGNIPFSSKFGISYSTLKDAFTVNIDVAYRKEYLDLLTGMEIKMQDLIQLRGLIFRGGVYLHEINEGADFSLGLGYLYNVDNYSFRADYAFKYPLSNLDDLYGTHFVSATFMHDFGTTAVMTIDDHLMDKSEAEKELEEALKQIAMEDAAAAKKKSSSKGKGVKSSKGKKRESAYVPLRPSQKGSFRKYTEVFEQIGVSKKIQEKLALEYDIIFSKTNMKEYYDIYTRRKELEKGTEEFQKTTEQMLAIRKGKYDSFDNKIKESITPEQFIKFEESNPNPYKRKPKQSSSKKKKKKNTERKHPIEVANNNKSVILDDFIWPHYNKEFKRIKVTKTEMPKIIKYYKTYHTKEKLKILRELFDKRNSLEKDSEEREIIAKEYTEMRLNLFKKYKKRIEKILNEEKFKKFKYPFPRKKRPVTPKPNDTEKESEIEILDDTKSTNNINNEKENNNQE